MPADDRKLVTIAIFDTEFEASLARGVLESAGIPALVPAEALGAFSRRRGLTPQSELQVFEDDRERALDVLNDVHGR